MKLPILIASMLAAGVLLSGCAHYHGGAYYDGYYRPYGGYGANFGGYGYPYSGAWGWPNSGWYGRRFGGHGWHGGWGGGWHGGRR